MRTLFLALIASVLFLAACGEKDLNVEKSIVLDSGLNVIYGSDDRKDYYQIRNMNIKKMAHSTVALVDKSDLRKIGSHYQVLRKSFAHEYGLCPNVKYGKQVSLSFCSGILVAKDLVLTAGHCVFDQDSCEETQFVFDF